MEIENAINSLIKEYKRHLKKCEKIMEETKRNDPKAYFKHQEFRKFWNIMLNDLSKLSEIVSNEKNQHKSRRD